MYINAQNAVNSRDVRSVVPGRVRGTLCSVGINYVETIIRCGLDAAVRATNCLWRSTESEFIGHLLRMDASTAHHPSDKTAVLSFSLSLSGEVFPTPRVKLRLIGAVLL